MAARAYWRGHLRLSLVSIGVELYSAAASSRRLALHQIHKPSGKRVRYQKVAPGVGPIDTDEIVKGFEVEKDEYVLLEPEELDEIKLETKNTIELVQFVDHCEIDPRYFEKPYYVVPDNTEVAEEGFTVIREALRETEKVGLGQMAVRGRDHVVAIKPCGRGLLLETLRYADEIRASDDIFRDISEEEADEEMQDLAEELIGRKSAPFDPEAFKSQYAKALRDLIEEKRKTGKIATGADEDLPERGADIIDLREALKKSVAKNKKKAPAKKTSKRKTASKKSTKRKAS